MRHVILSALALVMLSCLPKAAPAQVYANAKCRRLVADHDYRDWDRADYYWRHRDRDDRRHWKRYRCRYHHDRDDYYRRHRSREGYWL